MPEPLIFAFLTSKSGAACASFINSQIVKLGKNWWHEVQGNEAAFRETCKRLEVTSSEEVLLGAIFQKWCCSAQFVDLTESVTSSNDLLAKGKQAETALNELLKKENLKLKLSTSEIVEIYLTELLFTFSIIDERFREQIYMARHEHLAKDTKQILAQFDVVHAQLSTLINKEQVPFEIPKEELAYHAEVDLAKKHTDRNKPSAALELLKDLRDRIQNEISTQKLLFRIATTAMVALIQMERFEEALEEARNALNFERSPTALCNAANCNLHCGNLETAMDLNRRAIELAPNNPFALSIQLQILVKTDPEADVSMFLEQHPHLTNLPVALMTLGQIETDQEHFEKAREYFAQARARDPYSAQLYQLEGQAIALPIERNPQLYNPRGGGLATETRADLEHVVFLTTECLKLLSHDELIFDRNRAYLLRASAKFFIGDTDGAFQDCQEVLATDSDNNYALQKAGSLISQTKPREAIDLLKRVHGPLQKMAQLVMCDCYIRLGDFPTATQMLNECKQSNLPGYLLIQNQLEISRLSNDPNIEQDIAAIRSKYNSDADVLYAVCDHYQAAGQLDQALEVIEEARKAPKGLLTHHILPAKANLLMQVRAWKKAIEIFEQYIDTTVINTDSINYIIALSNAGENGTAWVEAKKIRARNNGRAVTKITEIESMYWENCGHIVECREACISILKENLQTPETLARLRRMNAKLGKTPDSIN